MVQSVAFTLINPLYGPVFWSAVDESGADLFLLFDMSCFGCNGSDQEGMIVWWCSKASVQDLWVCGLSCGFALKAHRTWP